eukprot:4663423-Pleurochrysis_carterae.AAC.3
MRTAWPTQGSSCASHARGRGDCCEAHDAADGCICDAASRCWRRDTHACRDTAHQHEAAATSTCRFSRSLPVAPG